MRSLGRSSGGRIAIDGESVLGCIEKGAESATIVEVGTEKSVRA
jgi:hypothetical protein